MIARRSFQVAGSRVAAVWLGMASLGAAGCSDNTGPHNVDAGALDAGTGPIVGGKLGAAIASAAAAGTAAPTANAKSNDPQAPPENGIFAAGEADKRQPRSAPPKLDLLSEGEGTKVQLANKLDVAEQKTTVSVGMRMGQARVPTIEFALSIKPEKAKGDKPKDAPADAAAHLVASVTGTNLPSTANMPKDMIDAIGKLKGTVVRYDFTAAGVASNYVVEAPKGAGEGLELVLDALVDSMSLMTAPLPAKPVGTGANWIVADRAKVAAGLDVVRYRVFKVLKIEGDAVTMSLDVRQYSAEPKLKVDAGPQKQEVGLDAFDSQGKGTVVWKADAFLPRADATEKLAARIALPGGQQPPGGRGAPVVQTEMTAAIGGGSGTAPAPDKP